MFALRVNVLLLRVMQNYTKKSVEVSNTMKKKLTTVEFHGTKEQEERLVAVCAKYKDTMGKMMPILQEAQEIYGYLPAEVQKIIARETGVSQEEIYGIISFYAQFKLNPDGEVAIAVCLGTACYVKGAQELIDAIEADLGISNGSTSADGKFSLEATRCIGACGLAPVLTVNGEVYGRLTEHDIPGILAKYKA